VISVKYIIIHTGAAEVNTALTEGAGPWLILVLPKCKDKCLSLLTAMDIHVTSLTSPKKLQNRAKY